MNNNIAFGATHVNTQNIFLFLLKNTAIFINSSTFVLFTRTMSLLNINCKKKKLEV